MERLTKPGVDSNPYRCNDYKDSLCICSIYKRLQYFEDLVDSGKIELPQEFGGFTGKSRSDIL